MFEILSGIWFCKVMSSLFFCKYKIDCNHDRDCDCDCDLTVGMTMTMTVTVPATVTVTTNGWIRMVFFLPFSCTSKTHKLKKRQTYMNKR
jgi:hypothetical protein